MLPRDCPPPNHCHPALSRYKDDAQKYLIGSGPFYFRIAVVHRIKMSDFTEIHPTDPAQTTMRTLDFSVHEAQGPMPFIGNPEYETWYYHWYVGVDQYKRCISSDSRIKIIPYPIKYKKRNNSGLI